MIRTCNCTRCRSSRSRGKAFLFSIVLACALILCVGPPGCVPVSDDQVKQSATQAQAKVESLQQQLDQAKAVWAPTTQAIDQFQRELDALRAQPEAATDTATQAAIAQGQASLDAMRTKAAQLTALIDTTGKTLGAASGVLQQMKDHPDQAPDLTPLATATAPIPYSGLFWAAVSVGAWLVQEIRKGKLKKALDASNQDLADHQTALSEIVPQVQGLKKLVPPENLSLWKQDAAGNYSDATKALVAVNKPDPNKG